MARKKIDPIESTVEAPLVVDGVAYYDSDDVPAAAAELTALRPLVKHDHSGRPLVISKALVNEIVKNIEAGAFVHVAAQAAGVATETFYRWCRLGRADCKPDARPDYLAAHALWRELANRVEIAKAKARLTCEIAVAVTKPSTWLRLGPGRDTGDPERPGWTNPATKIEGKLTHELLHRRAEPVRIDLSRLTDEELKAFARLTDKMSIAAPTADDEAIDVSCEEVVSDGL